MRGKETVDMVSETMLHPARLIKAVDRSKSSTELMKGLSMILLAKNEEKTVSAAVRAAWFYADEVIVMDGHSTDKTRDLAKAEGASVFLDDRKGKGSAMRAAIWLASYDVLVFMDTDGSHEPADIPRLIRPILEDGFDLIIGSRGTGGSDELHGDFNKFVRLIGSSIITLIINGRWGVHLTDCQNGFRAVRTSVARALKMKAKSTTIEQEMVMKCLKNNFRIGEVPSHEYERKFGSSSIVLRKVWIKYLYCLLKNLI